MSLFRRSKWAAFGSVAVVALLLAVTVGAYRAVAARGIPGDFFVSIIGPVEDEDTLEILAYTPGASVPPQIPIGVDTLVSLPFRGGEPILDSVRTVLGGDFDPDTDSISGEAQSVEATLYNEGEFDEYLAVVNASLLDFEPEVVRGESLPGIIASDFIRSVAIIDTYYSSPARTVSNIGGISEIGLTVRLRDLADVDNDGNLIPDATALLQRYLLLIDGNGDICIVIALDEPLLRGTSSDIEFDLSFETALGPITVELAAPTLESMQLAAGGALDEFDTARLILGISRDPASLLDGPDGVDPLAEFDLDTPEPQNLFARVNVAFTSILTRGTIAPVWSFAGTPDVLPGGLLPTGIVTDLTLRGPGIAALLEDGSEVAAYTYDNTMSQTGEDLFADGNETGWVEVEDVELSNNDNADDEADARVVVASAGDDKIEIRSRNISAIYGSNAVPSLDTGGGGGGSTCFIATAAFGTPMATEIDALRGVRDQYMFNNIFGSTFADAYYRLSPPVANKVAQSELLKQTVRGALQPVVAMSKWTLSSPGSALMLIVVLAGFSIFLLPRRRA